LQHPENPLVRSLKEKRNLLVFKLLINSVEAGDILDVCLTAARRSIDFPPITFKDVRKSVLEARNTTLKVDEILIAIL
jgi:hypothetical protein